MASLATPIIMGVVAHYLIQSSLVFAGTPMGTGALLGLGAGFAWSFAVLSCFPVFPRAASAGRLIMILLADMALAAAIALASALVLVLVVATIASVIL